MCQTEIYHKEGLLLSDCVQAVPGSNPSPLSLNSCLLESACKNIILRLWEAVAIQVDSSALEGPI